MDKGYQTTLFTIKFDLGKVLPKLAAQTKSDERKICFFLQRPESIQCSYLETQKVIKWKTGYISLKSGVFGIADFATFRHYKWVSDNISRRKPAPMTKVP